MFAGYNHVAAITQLGNVFIWGDGADGQLGINERCRQSSRPYLVRLRHSCVVGVHDSPSHVLLNQISSLRKVPMLQVACGSCFTLAVAQDGSLYSWGCGEDGELGQGPDVAQLYKPQQVEVCVRVCARARGSFGGTIAHRDLCHSFSKALRWWRHRQVLTTPSSVPATRRCMCGVPTPLASWYLAPAPVISRNSSPPSFPACLRL